MYVEEIKAIIAKHAQLSVDPQSLRADSNLYDAGLSSLSTVNLMLALEDHFGVEFKDSMLGRKTFGTLGTLSEAIEELRGVAVTGR